jgi:hypothetical protein
VSTDTTNPTTEVVPVVSQATMALFAQMAVGIPEADDSEAYEGIVTQLLSADGIDGLNAPWDGDKAASLAGHRLKIESMARRASDFSEGLGIYLVIKGTDMDSGELFTLTIGSVSILAQLARIWHLKGLPAIVELVIAERATSKGFRPMHLKVYTMAAAQ